MLAETCSALDLRTATASSNSAAAGARCRCGIDACARERGLDNLEVITRDVNALAFDRGTRFDRVVSVEMFEHLRNGHALFERISDWLEPGGTLFVRVFTHAQFAYPFDVNNDSDFMARSFFTGGIMRIVDHGAIDGRDYQLTAQAWLQNMEAARADLMPLLAET